MNVSSRQWEFRPWAFLALAVSAIVVALPPISPSLLLPAGSASGLSALLMAAAAFACHRRRRRAFSHSESQFWKRLSLAGAGWTVLVLGHSLPVAQVLGKLGGEAVRWLGLGLDSLFLLVYLPIVLALDLRPHRRADRRHPWPVRQLQLTAAYLLVVLVGVYGSVLPRSWEGERLSPHFLWPAEGFLALLCLSLARRRSSGGWRLIYFALTAVFGAQTLAHLGAGFGRGWTGASEAWSSSLAPAPGSWLAPWMVACTVATALALLVAARVEGSGEERVVRERSGGRPLLLFDLPVVLTASVLPICHLVLMVSGGWVEGQVQERHWVVLLSLVVLVPLAFFEQVFLRRRSAYLEIEQRRAVRETEERSIYLSSLIEHSPLAIVVLDPSHRVRLCNPAFERLFDFASEEVAGSTLDRLISDGSSREEAATFTAKVLGGESIHATTRRLRKGGEPVDVEVYGVPLMRDGELTGIFAIYQDVSERLRSAQAIRESEERFRRLSDAAFEGIVVSKGGEILDCNEQYARLVGLEPHEVVGRSIEDFVAPSDRRRVAEHLAEDREEPYEHRILRTDGSSLIVEVRGRSVPFEGQRVRVAAVRDMTERKRFEEEIRQSQKMEAVGRLAGGIAHDFNNLLTVIKGYGQLLSMQMPEGRLRGLVGEILEASERAALMTQRLLAFGRKQAVQPQVVDLSAVIVGMEKILRRLIRADIRFDFHLAEDLAKVKVDPSQIEQVVLNLAINAGDAMPEGGTLELRTYEGSASDSTTSGVISAEVAAAAVAGAGSGAATALAASDFVCLEVRDSGMGMDPETRAQVFEPFFTTKAKGKGTGLGLATVYAIVQQNGGAIEVESEPGEGTCFRIFLPRVPDATKDDQRSSIETRLPRGDETVMVVEDEPGVRALAVEFLELHGYRVLQAEDGEAGVALFESASENIDMVLSDVVMPKLNGPQMVEKLLAIDPDLRVLYMSGYTDRKLGKNAPGAAWRLVQKPFSVAGLILEVRKALDGGDPGARVSEPPAGDPPGAGLEGRSDGDGAGSGPAGLESP